MHILNFCLQSYFNYFKWCRKNSDFCVFFSNRGRKTEKKGEKCTFSKKKQENIWWIQKKWVPLHRNSEITLLRAKTTLKSSLKITKQIGVWCNGNTADSGPAFSGSSPDTPTKSQTSIEVWLFSFSYTWDSCPNNISLFYTFYFLALLPLKPAKTSCNPLKLKPAKTSWNLLKRLSS